MRKIAFVLFATMVPTQASALKFGFVRVPDWMDPYAFFLLCLTGSMYAATLAFKPRHAPIRQMYKHFHEFSFVGRVFYVLLILSLGALMGLIFVGMALRRAAEAGFQGF